MICTILLSNVDAQTMKIGKNELPQIVGGIWNKKNEKVSNGLEFTYSWGKSRLNHSSFAIDISKTRSILQVIDGEFDIARIEIDNLKKNTIRITPVWEDGRMLAGELIIELLDRNRLILRGDENTIAALWLDKDITYYKIK